MNNFIYGVKYKVFKGMFVGIYSIVKVLYVVIIMYDGEVFEIDVLINNINDLIILVFLDICKVVDIFNNKMNLFLVNGIINLDNEIWVGSI